MNDTLHITSGDCAGGSLAKSGVLGEVFVWHDVLYTGPRKPGWPDDATLKARARFLEDSTAGGLDRKLVLNTLKRQYRKLADAAAYDRIVLWFDACLFDQSMLVHILTCLRHKDIRNAELLCIDALPGIVPFNGLGQLKPSQMASLQGKSRLVTDAQFRFAEIVDEAFATQNPALLSGLARRTNAPLTWVPAAVARWLQERPDAKTGLGRLEHLALQAIRSGCKTPCEIYSAVAKADSTPQFWGDTTLWKKINALADRKPPLVRIEGPAKRLPQWAGKHDPNEFTVMPVQTR